MTHDVVVVGGGLGGALVARALDLAGVDVTVLDAGTQPGGLAAPRQRDGYLLEPAVGTLTMPHPHLGRLLEGLDLTFVPAAPAAARRMVYHRGVVHTVAPGPSILSSRLVSVAGKVRAAGEVFVSPETPPDETLAAFLQRRFGRETGRLAAWLAATGVYAGDPRKLSVQAAFPTLVALEQSDGSLLRGIWSRRGKGEGPSPHVVEGGTAMVAIAVAESLGERWMSGFQVGKVRPDPPGWKVEGSEVLTSERVVLAVGPHEACRLLGRPDPLGETETAPVAVVWLGCGAPKLPEAMGILVGPDENFYTLGFLFESSYAPARAPTGGGLVKAIVGGATHPEVVDLPDDELVSRVTSELGQVLGSGPVVDMAHVVRHRPGIPQYTARRRRILTGLARELPTGLDLAGWAYDGVGVGRLATAAVTMAERTVWETHEAESGGARTMARWHQ